MPGTVVLNPAMVDGYGNPISFTRDEGMDANRLLVSGLVTKTPTDTAAKKVVGADLMVEGVSETTYYVAIDLDDGYGSYKHTGSSSIKLSAISGVLLKTKNVDSWHTLVGAILSINGTQATIGFLQVGAMHASDTNTFGDKHLIKSFPIDIDLTSAAGAYNNIAGGLLITTTAVNNLSTLKDVDGNDVVPAIGDLVVRLEQSNGSGLATLHYSFWYYVE